MPEHRTQTEIVARLLDELRRDVDTQQAVFERYAETLSIEDAGNDLYNGVDQLVERADALRYEARKLLLGLPSFDEARFDARARLGDVEDVLRSDWREGGAPTREQSQAASDAREHIANAKAALDRAAR